MLRHAALHSTRQANIASKIILLALNWISHNSSLVIILVLGARSTCKQVTPFVVYIVYSEY